MTQEEKARAYDDALKRAKNIKSKILQSRLSTESCKVVSEYIDEIIPQLRESEDERIRKILIHIVKGACGKYGIKYKEGEITEEKLLAYLEKQKDASKAIEAVDRIDKYIDEHLANAHDMKDSNPEKKYYRGWDDALGKMAGILQDVYSDEKQKEQKPVEGKEYSSPECGTTAWSEELDIDTLREWSMRYAPDIRQAIESTAYHFYNLSHHWKPSEEQMNGLETAIVRCQMTGLESLYEDLKKLM